MKDMPEQEQMMITQSIVKNRRRIRAHKMEGNKKKKERRRFR